MEVREEEGTEDIRRGGDKWVEAGEALAVDGSDSATCFRLTVPEPNHITII